MFFVLYLLSIPIEKIQKLNLVLSHVISCLYNYQAYIIIKNFVIF